MRASRSDFGRCPGCRPSFLPALAAEAPERPLKSRAAIASTLVAGLELARTGEAATQQPESFATIDIRVTSPVP